MNIFITEVILFPSASFVFGHTFTFHNEFFLLEFSVELVVVVVSIVARLNYWWGRGGGGGEGWRTKAQKLM